MEFLVEVIVTGDEEISYEVGDLIDKKKGKRTYSRPVFAKDTDMLFDILKETCRGISGLKTIKIKKRSLFLPLPALRNNFRK